MFNFQNLIAMASQAMMKKLIAWSMAGTLLKRVLKRL